MKVFEYIGSESNHKKEQSQIARIEKMIIEWGKEANLTDIWLFKNVNYFHKSLGLNWNKQSWNGEIDLLLISKNHFVIFELKNKKGVVSGQTHQGKWKIKYYDASTYTEEKDYFMQCSKMKVFFSRNYYPKKILPKIDVEYTLRPDVLLVFLDGSDVSNIFYGPPVRFKVDEWYSILSKLNDEDKDFMESNFHFEKKRDIININFGGAPIDLKRVKTILEFCDYEERVSKWFRVITESKIKELLPNIGADTFEFNEQIVGLLVKDFHLKLDKEYCV